MSAGTAQIVQPRSPLARVLESIRVHGTILRISAEERLVYRADFALATLMRFLPIVTTILLWRAIYDGVQGGAADVDIAGYRYGDMVAYYLLAMVGRAFSSMPGLASGIARDVRDGTIKKYLIQPVDLLGFLFWARMAHKLVYYAIALGPFVLTFFLCRGFFRGWPDALTLAGGALALLLSFIVGFLFEACIGLIAFWFLEVSSMLFVVMMLNYFFSGHMFPLDVLPAGMVSVVKLLPFQYFAYFPAVVFLGRMSHDELAWGLLVQAGWAVGLFLLARWLLQRGLRRYSAFGG